MANDCIRPDLNVELPDQLKICELPELLDSDAVDAQFPD